MVLPELDVMKSVTWIFHMDDLQKNSRYDIIIGQDLLLKIKLGLCFSIYTIKRDGGAYEECTTPMKDPSNLYDVASLRNEE